MISYARNRMDQRTPHKVIGHVSKVVWLGNAWRVKRRVVVAVGQVKAIACAEKQKQMKKAKQV